MSQAENLFIEKQKLPSIDGLRRLLMSQRETDTSSPPSLLPRNSDGFSSSSSSSYERLLVSGAVVDCVTVISAQQPHAFAQTPISIESSSVYPNFVLS
jgi:hypothetical protein